MATVTKWTPFGVALDVTATGGTVTRKSATQFTVAINVSWETYYEGAQTNYGMTATSGGVTHTISAFNGTKRSSGSGSFTGTYSISGNGSATKSITVTFKNFNSDNGDSASKNVTFNVNVPAWTSYTVSYNANGGSGAPSAQTKWKDQTLTLSSTKPTRTGHTFQGWATSSTATSATYSAGGSYTANSGATLYAVWKANTYAVNYNANGGTGAPAKQTKTYGVTLKLSTTKPTRTNYNFLGWGTSASATTVSYAAGASYTANAAVTLYAIWELAYVKPRITNASVTRCVAADQPVNTVDLWESGTYSSYYGTKADSTARARTIDYIPANVRRIAVSGTTYQVAIYAYDANDVYVGNYSSDGWSKPSSNNDNKYWFTECELTNEYRYKLAVRVYNNTPLTSTTYSIEKAASSVSFHGQGLYEPDDDGTFAHVVFDWASDRAVSSISIEFEGSDGSTQSLNPSASGTSGSVDEMVDGLLAEVTYTVKMTVTDAIDYYTEVVTLSGSKFVIDILAEGKGIAFNKPAELEGVADIGFQTRLTGGLSYPVLPPETDLNDLRTPNFYSGENVSTYNYVNCPITAGTFTLEVFSSGPNGQTLQRLTRCDKTKSTVYERWFYTNAWSDWTGGWVYPTIGSEFAIYSSDGGSAPACRKDGRLVEVRGIVKPAVDIAGSTDMHTIMTVPAGYRPVSPVYTICQGSNNCTWLLRVSSNGAVDLSRYRNGNTTATATAGTWLPFQVTYFVE